jgi:hypothetical protein
MFHTTAAVTASQSNGPLTIKGTGIRGLAARVVIPATSTTGVNGTLQAKYYHSDDNSSYTPAYAVGDCYARHIGKELITPIITNKKYIKEELVVTDTTPSFGVVVSGLVDNIGFKWSRRVR